MLPKTDGRDLPLFAPERWGITSWVSAIKAADNFHANTHSGREFGDTLNRVKFRFSKANCRGSQSGLGRRFRIRFGRHPCGEPTAVGATVPS